MDVFTNRQRFSRLGGYSNAKFAQTLLARQLALDLRPVGIVVNCVHPGMVSTAIGRDDWLSGLVLNTMRSLFPFLLLTPQQGALTALWAALSQEVTGATGRFLYDLAEDPVSWVLQRDLANGKGVELVSYLKTLYESASRSCD